MKTKEQEKREFIDEVAKIAGKFVLEMIKEARKEGALEMYNTATGLAKGTVLAIGVAMNPNKQSDLLDDLAFVGKMVTLHLMELAGASGKIEVKLKEEMSYDKAESN